MSSFLHSIRRKYVAWAVVAEISHTSERQSFDFQPESMYTAVFAENRNTAAPANHVIRMTAATSTTLSTLKTTQDCMHAVWLHCGGYLARHVPSPPGHSMHFSQSRRRESEPFWNSQPKAVLGRASRRGRSICLLRPPMEIECQTNSREIDEHTPVTVIHRVWLVEWPSRPWETATS